MSSKYLYSLLLLTFICAACGDDDSVAAPVTPQPVTPQPGAPVPGTSVPASLTPGAPAPAGASNFGTVSLRHGFQPDPHLARGTSGGQVNAANLDGSCAGWIASQPDHIFVAESAFPDLRIMVNGGTQDTTLVIRKPDQSYLCNDDGPSEGTNPVISGTFAPGTYQVWIGSYTQGESGAYTIGFTELGNITTASLGGSGSAAQVAGGDSNFGTVTLAPNFPVDPTTAAGTAGGSVQASSLDSNCAGWVSSVPDHLLVTTGSFSMLRVMVRSPEDTTLVIQKPDGSYLCNDDISPGNINPLVTGPFPAGTYKVMVGSYEQNGNSSYTIGFSELSSVVPERLPTPS